MSVPPSSPSSPPSGIPSSGRSCSAFREETAVALLTGTDLPDEVLAHHATCAACREEFTRLAVLPALLDATRDETVPPVEVPNQALLQRTLGEMAHRRRRRRFTLVVAAAAAVLVVGVSGALLATPGRPAAGPPAGELLVADGTTQSSVSDAGADVHVYAAGPDEGSVVLVKGWGVTGGTTCRIELTDSGGWTHTIKTWTAQPGEPKRWQIRIPVSVAPREVRDVRLVDNATDKVLVTVPLSPA